MSITQQCYMEKIKPVVDKIYEVVNTGQLSDVDKTLAEGFLIKIVDNETDLPKLLEIVKSASPLERRICEKHGITLAVLEAALQE